MLANDLNLSIHNILIYSLLTLYGLVMTSVLIYIHSRFDAASNQLKQLATECESAKSRHVGLVEAAGEQLSKLTAVEPVPPLAPLGTDLDLGPPNQVAAIGTSEAIATKIARSYGVEQDELESSWEPVAYRGGARPAATRLACIIHSPRFWHHDPINRG